MEELAFAAIVVIAGGVFAIGNVFAHVIRKNIQHAGTAFKYLVQGAVAGTVLGAGIAFATSIPALLYFIKGGGIVYGGAQALSIAAGFGYWMLTGDRNRSGNAGKLFLGNFYLDENQSFFGGIWQGISRYTWELPQTFLGGIYSQLRNTAGRVGKAGFLAGATFAVREKSPVKNGVSLGSFLNVNIPDEITGVFENRVTTDPLFMHEYGHIAGSQASGWFYLPVIGAPSVISAATARQIPGKPPGVTTHNFRWYEIQTNRHAANYFCRHYGAAWSGYEMFYPRQRP